MKITHFDHERIPERIVHARGSGAHGFFECTKSLSEFTRASLLGEVGKQTLADNETPTEWVPCLGKPVSSTARMPRRSGVISRKRVHIGPAGHGESVMKCCSAW